MRDDDFDYEFSPDDIAKIKRSIQEANMGFTFEMLHTEEGYFFKCNKCGRQGAFHEKPFPHRFDCPMKNLGKDD